MLQERQQVPSATARWLLTSHFNSGKFCNSHCDGQCPYRVAVGLCVCLPSALFVEGAAAGSSDLSIFHLHSFCSCAKRGKEGEKEGRKEASSTNTMRVFVLALRRDQVAGLNVGTMPPASMLSA